jgi:hypothetical protein
VVGTLWYYIDFDSLVLSGTLRYFLVLSDALSGTLILRAS